MGQEGKYVIQVRVQGGKWTDVKGRDGSLLQGSVEWTSGVIVGLRESIPHFVPVEYRAERRPQYGQEG